MSEQHMAREMTPQERAAALLDRIVGIIPMQPSQREARIEWLVEFAQATRRAALLECAKVARNRADLYKPKLGLWLNMVNYHRSQEADDLADTLDRLAQEG